MLGKHSGSRAVQVVYAGLGIAVDEIEAHNLLPHLRFFVAERKQPPETPDLLLLLASIRRPLHVV